ncbi:ABC transporter permease [Vagococcus sp. DIV0080]|uniref:ABC transporter permease n=1 Tax=Candidatus Vagococcus giribetii TaxID=2230876 RepID=A0ABS3HP17_9ENTE|nr:ABC transporter permease [Vagococcus sp. DIV0080]MBO0475483.1 ABC transporter permease [Vagococcus sp. DIV0080]
MKLVETIRMILINLIQNKYKVLLTSLGIIIGTLTIVLVIAIGQGGEKQIADQFKNMSAETIYVNYQPIAQPKKDEPKMGLNEIELIKEENPYIKDIYLRSLFNSDVSVQGKKENQMITAVSSGYSDVSNYQIEVGRDFSDDDYQSEKKVLVIGYSMAEKLFKTPEKALTGKVQMNGNLYEVIGVLKKTSEGLQGVSPDDTLFIPYETAQKEKLLSAESFPQAVALANNQKDLEKAKQRIQSSLDYVFDDSSVYEVEDAGSRIEAAMASATTMKVLLLSMSIIVFLVGGIGIMNVLFVSVKERTKEIGILKAIGTTRKDILFLFLLESIGIGIFGGSIGVILSFVAIPILEKSNIPTFATWEGKVVAFLFAVLTATIFGFYPAYKASKLKPIEALTQD